MNNTNVYLALIGFAVVILLIVALARGWIHKARLLFKNFGVELVGQGKNIYEKVRNDNWVIGPDEGKYDLSSGVLRHIPDPQTLEALGYERSKFVRLSDSAFCKLSRGHEIQSVRTANLVRRINTSGVYAVIEGEKRWVPNPETLAAIGRNFEEVKDLRPEDFDAIKQGTKLVEVSHWSNT